VMIPSVPMTSGPLGFSRLSSVHSDRRARNMDGPHKR
jgi:hypothetical protein